MQDQQKVEKEINTWKGQMTCRMGAVNWPVSHILSGSVPIKPIVDDSS